METFFLIPHHSLWEIYRLSLNSGGKNEKIWAYGQLRMDGGQSTLLSLPQALGILTALHGSLL